MANLFTGMNYVYRERNLDFKPILKTKAMEENYHYDTVSGAIKKLRERGFNVDFNLEENCLVCHLDKFEAEDFEIVDVYRYEGNSDPADEAVVYAIESKTGVKGVLVTGYGIYSDTVSAKILEKLHNRKG
jgi:hypothetical protein